ncbi:MAG: Hsp70 family protein, partial [Aeromicrobium sp.]|uniref:Hsp70 family protein n=1 Tax=Aeromicrobium sp. TaxID=1871063 RepID=UPI003C62EB19
EMAAGNQQLATFELTGLPPAPRGVPQIEVTFDIDANGIVNVSAKDRGTGKEQSMTITGGSALSKDDIDKMVKDAEEYAEEDRQRREAVESRNQAETLSHSTEKFLAENGDKIDEATKTEVQADLDALNEALKGEDAEAVQAAVTKLGESSQKMGEAMYAAAAAEQQAAGDAPTSDDATDDDDDVVEAEIVDEEPAEDDSK